MKILTPEEEQAHAKTTWENGAIGGAGGLAIASLGVWAASRRYHAFRQLSLPLKAFLVTSGTTFVAVISADRASRRFERQRHGDSDYQNQSETLSAQASAGKTRGERFKAFVSEERYPIVFGSWIASMAAAFAIVSRNKHATGQQKLVQARVYAQGLTLAVLVASFALEGNDLRAGKGRWETVKVVDPDDPEGRRMIEKRIHHEAYEGEDQWMDMIQSSEQKMKQHGHKVRKNDPGEGDIKKGNSEKDGNNDNGDKNNENGNESDNNQANDSQQKKKGNGGSKKEKKDH